MKKEKQRKMSIPLSNVKRYFA